MSLTYALIAHANAFLNAGEPMPDWVHLPENGYLYHDFGLFWNRSVRFATPQTWADWLKSRDVARVRFFKGVQENPHKFEKMGILTEGPLHRMLWSPRGESAHGSGGYATHFVCRGEDLDRREQCLSATIDEAELEFQRANQALVENLRKREMNDWADHFSKGLTILENEYVPTLEVEKIFPRIEYSDRARRLFSAFCASSGFKDGVDFYRDRTWVVPEPEWSDRCHADWLAIVAALNSYP